MEITIKMTGFHLYWYFPVGDYELFHQNLVSKLHISKSSSMQKQTLKSAFLTQNYVFVKWRIKTQFFFVQNLEPHINYLHGSLMYYSNTLSTKKIKKRWGRTEIDDTQSLLLTRRESDLDGYSSCFPHTFTLWHKLLCTPHRLQSWSAKKAGKRPLEDKIWSKTLVCRNHKDNT